MASTFSRRFLTRSLVLKGLPRAFGQNAIRIDGRSFYAVRNPGERRCVIVWRDGGSEVLTW